MAADSWLQFYTLTIGAGNKNRAWWKLGVVYKGDINTGTTLTGSTTP